MEMQTIKQKQYNDIKICTNNDGTIDIEQKCDTDGYQIVTIEKESLKQLINVLIKQIIK